MGQEPMSDEIEAALRDSLSPAMFRARYVGVFGQRGTGGGADAYAWAPASTYIKRPPIFDGLTREPAAPRDIVGARILMLLGDSVTTDHISPIGPIARGSPAARSLEAQGVARADFNVYGARRANH